jgi:hypothetical protein
MMQKAEEIMKRYRTALRALSRSPDPEENQAPPPHSR